MLENVADILGILKKYCQESSKKVEMLLATRVMRAFSHEVNWAMVSFDFFILL